MGVALVAPVALVVARTGVVVEVAVLLARRLVLTRDLALKAALVVVTHADAVLVLGVDVAVAVVVEAVSASVDLAPALADHAVVATAQVGVAGVGSAAQVVIWRGDAAAGGLGA